MSSKTLVIGRAVAMIGGTAALIIGATFAATNGVNISDITFSAGNGLLISSASSINFGTSNTLAFTGSTAFGNLTTVSSEPTTAPTGTGFPFALAEGTTTTLAQLDAQVSGIGTTDLTGTNKNNVWLDVCGVSTPTDCSGWNSLDALETSTQVTGGSSTLPLPAVEGSGGTSGGTQYQLFLAAAPTGTSTSVGDSVGFNLAFTGQ